MFVALLCDLLSYLDNRSSLLYSFHYKWQISFGYEATGHPTRVPRPTKFSRAYLAYIVNSATYKEFFHNVWSSGGGRRDNRVANICTLVIDKPFDILLNSHTPPKEGEGCKS